MFQPNVIAQGVKSDFADLSIAAFQPNAPRVAYGTAGFRTIGSALPPIAYRCVFVVFCRSLNARLSTPTAAPFDGHHFLINPSTIGDCGMMITASHNPAPDNGLKIVDPDGGMFTMDWEADATDVANVRDAEAFGAALATFAKQHLVMGPSGATEAVEEAPLFKLLKDRPVTVHIGRDTRASGDAILASVKAAAATINRIFGPIVFGAGESSSAPNARNVIELVDHGILTTPTLHAMVYWNRHHHELPVEELGLVDPTDKSRDSDASTLIAAATSAHATLMGAGYTAGTASASSAVDVRRSLATALSTPITKAFNERLVFRAFVSLWAELGINTSHANLTAGGAAASNGAAKTIVVDCSNGVGSLIMRESLALPIAVLPEDRAYLKRIASSSSPIIPDGATEVTIQQLVEVVTGIRFALVHDDIANHSLLNKDCGADHTQKTRVPSAVFGQQLSAFVHANKASLIAEAKAVLSSSSSSSSSSYTDVEAFCMAVGKRIGFYCFDGDADRVVSFAPCPIVKKEEGGAAVSLDGDVDALIAATQFELLDGDRIAVLMASLVRDALRRPSSGALASSSTTSGGTPMPQMGVVQTAYANGASTNYIMSKLHIPTVCAATGVKYLHPKAEAMEVGIYFEANGHGTTLSAAGLYATPVTLAETGTRSRSGSGLLGAGAVVPPGAKHQQQHATNSPLSTASSSTPAVANRVIVPSAFFGHGAVPPSQGLKNLLLLRLLLSQCCGDAIADMLACELGLAALQWTAYHWQAMYSDLPSITGKTTVKDPSVIKNTPDQRQATHPVGLQAKIDAIVASVGGPSVLARSFVRPSGTEPIVRVYTEATTPEITKELFDKVAAVVGEMCH